MRRHFSIAAVLLVASLAGFVHATVALAQTPPATPIPPVTEEDRRAAFPQVAGHSVHDDGAHFLVLGDRLEWQGDRAGGLSWEQRGWLGHDRDRLWFRTEGETGDGRLETAEAHVLYGRAIARWWDVVGGVRQDWRPGAPRTWAAVGLQGLAPYWFEVEATGYVGEDFRTSARLEVEYQLRLTRRAVLQPLFELNVFGKDDPERGIGAGLSDVEFGLRLRYEIRPDLAPYAGVTWERKTFGTADFAREHGEATGRARGLVGLRWWF